jgi:hypothetical protein
MSDADCYAKAVKRGDYTFTLVGQDKSAPRVICEWISQNIETAPPEKLREALEKAIIMRTQWGRRNAD